MPSALTFFWVCYCSLPRLLRGTDLCQADWDQSAYRCTNPKCKSAAQGGGDIYATGEVETTNEFDRLNNECAKYLTALRKAAEIGQDAQSPGRRAADRDAAEALQMAGQTLVDAFRYLANTCVTLSHVDALKKKKKSQPGNRTAGGGAAAEEGSKEEYLKARLEELRAPLQTHAACAQERLTHDGEWSPSALRGERERSALLLAVSAMRREMQRFDAELLPLINDMEGAGKAAGGGAAAGTGAAGGAAAAAGGAAAEEEEGKSDKTPCIPCEVCGMLIPVLTFQTHLQKRHGVVYGHLVESLNDGADPLSRSGGKGGDVLIKPLAPGFGGQRDQVLDMPVVMPQEACPFIPPPPGCKKKSGKAAKPAPKATASPFSSSFTPAPGVPTGFAVATTSSTKKKGRGRRR